MSSFGPSQGWQRKGRPPSRLPQRPVPHERQSSGAEHTGQTAPSRLASRPVLPLSTALTSRPQPSPRTTTHAVRKAPRILSVCQTFDGALAATSEADCEGPEYSPLERNHGCTR
jgi:hypothetical protein